MKLLALFAGLFGLGTLGLLPSPALAETNEQVQAANATHTAVARARADLANAIAQGRITLTPTPTPIPATFTPRPTATPEPDPPTATPTALPALLLPLTDSDPLAAYIRPSTTDQTWLELALPQGRWNFRFDTPACEPLETWSNVWLAPGAVEPLLVARDDKQDSAMCGIVELAWHSDVPCAMTDGQCDVEGDAAYWAALAALAPAPPVADVLPTDQPSPAPLAVPRVSVSAPVSQFAPPAPVRQVQVVVQTVIVVVTAVPNDTPTPNPAASSVPTLANAITRPRLTPSPAATATVAEPAVTTVFVREGTPRPTLEVGGVQSAAANPGLTVTTPQPAEAPGPAPWLVVGLWLIVGLAVCGAIAIAGVRSGLIAFRSDRPSPVGSGADPLDAGSGPAFGTSPAFVAGVVAAIILAVILILIPMFIGLMDR